MISVDNYLFLLYTQVIIFILFLEYSEGITKKRWFEWIEMGVTKVPHFVTKVPDLLRKCPICYESALSELQ